LPEAASLQRTTAACKTVSDALKSIPGVQSVTAIAGFSLLSGVNTTYSGFFFVTLKPWEERTSLQQHLRQIMVNADEALRKIPDGTAFVFPPPSIPGRSCRDAGGLPCATNAEIH